MNLVFDSSAWHLAPIADGIITVFIGMVMVLSWLVLRQAHQMVEVLPTPISPLIRIAALSFMLLATLAFIISIGTFITW